MPVIATAAWSIPKNEAHQFPSVGSGLSRYASVFNGVAIHSTFHRRHKAETYARWAASVPPTFRFALKMPKEISHLRAMVDVSKTYKVFLNDIAPLGQKRGPLLIQLPPSLAFENSKFEVAFSDIRAADDGDIVIEPRHKSWKGEDASALLHKYSIGRVLADPAPVWPMKTFDGDTPYLRLHGSPRVYYSSYKESEITRYASLLGPNSWCVFDNTASGAATDNALAMLRLQ